MQALVPHVNGQTNSTLILHATHWIEPVETVNYIMLLETALSYQFYTRSLKSNLVLLFSF